MTTGPDAPKGLMDALPDPMKLDGTALLFVVVLLTVLYWFLKILFFRPVVRVMEEREAAIQAGASRRAEAAALVEKRQADYAARLKELRSRAFEHRKALAAAAAQERQALLEKARQEATEKRAAALADLRAAQETAKAELLTQVEALSESMVQHLLKQA